MKQMKVVDRANELMDRGLDPREAVDTHPDRSDRGEGGVVRRGGGPILIYQLAHERREKAGSEDSS